MIRQEEGSGWALFCAECGEAKDGYVEEGDFYCEQCWEHNELKRRRCFSFAVCYDEEGKVLSQGSSRGGEGCAERASLWKLAEEEWSIPKTIVVCRARRSKKKMTFGMSKPCQQCILSFPLYNVVRVCYSKEGNAFEWVDSTALSNSYRSKSEVIVRA